MVAIRCALLMLVISVAAMQAQFTYSNYNNSIIITKYVGTDTVVNIPDSIDGWPVVTLGNSCFYRATNVTSITVPGSVTNLLNSVFYCCYSLTNVTLPTSIATVGKYTFDSCYSLSSVVLPAGLHDISDGMFYSCTNLSSVNVPYGVGSIGINAFYKCLRLESIVIPATVNSIAFAAFSMSTNLISAYFVGNVPASGGLLFAFASKCTAYYMPGSTGWSTNFEGLPTVKWDPQIQTGDGAFGPRTDGFAFNITGPTNLTVVVVACTNLMNPVWTPVGTNTLVGGSASFADPHWTENPARCYRLRSP